MIVPIDPTVPCLCDEAGSRPGAPLLHEPPVSEKMGPMVSWNWYVSAVGAAESSPLIFDASLRSNVVGDLGAPFLSPLLGRYQD